MLLLSFLLFYMFFFYYIDSLMVKNGRVVLELLRLHNAVVRCQPVSNIGEVRGEVTVHETHTHTTYVHADADTTFVTLKNPTNI